MQIERNFMDLGWFMFSVDGKLFDLVLEDDLFNQYFYGFMREMTKDVLSLNQKVFNND